MSTGPKHALLAEYALIAAALASPARLAILEQLAQTDRSVEAVAARTGLTVANCSQHLQQLRRAGLATGQRQGRTIVYRLTDTLTLRLMSGLQQLAERNLAEVEHILRGLSGGDAPPEPVSRADLAARIARGEVTVLDLRPADEYAAGHLPGALNVTMRGLAALDLRGEIVAYCRGPYCLDARQAVTLLRARGIAARLMDGGLPDWRADGRPVAMAG